MISDPSLPSSSLADDNDIKDQSEPPPLTNAHTRPTEHWVPPSAHEPSSSTMTDRPRPGSEVPSTPSGEANQPFVRAGPVRPALMPSPSSSFRPTIRTTPILANKADTAAVGVNEAFVVPPRSVRSTPIPRPIKVERFTPSPRPASAVDPVVHGPPRPVSGSTTAGMMLPPPAPVCQTSVALGKRKANDAPLTPDSQSHPSNVKRERAWSTTSDIKPLLPIPILPIPLPSKRFKKRPTSRAVLIPVEQLPVFPLPPLPTIEDGDLVKQVFTHSSLLERVRWRFEDPMDDIAKHYEKLEHVGDSILGMVVTTWLHETRPNLTIGTATKLKAHLVSNATLSHLSGLYNLPQRLNGDPNLLPVLRAQTDVRAALMEAYIAALYFSFPLSLRLSEGIQTIDTWLREMYEPLYDFFYVYMKKEHEQHRTTYGATVDGHALLQSEAEMARIDQASIGMAALVQMYSSTQDRELRWEEERMETSVGALFQVKCTVDGIEVGEAIRVNKKAARNVAAWEAAKKLGLTNEVA